MKRLSLYSPRYWSTWLLIALHASLICLPFRLQLLFGKALGRLGMRLARRRRLITKANIALCFPNLTIKQQERLVRQHFSSLGMGIVEVAMCWWMPTCLLRRRVHIEGLNYLTDAVYYGRGVILLTGHFTSLELGGRLLGLYQPVLAVYRKHENPVVDHIMRSRRRRRSAGIIERGDTRSLIRSLRGGSVIWYAPDQAYLGPRGVSVPFFSVMAPTSTATSRLAELTGAPVLPFFVRRLPGAKGYQLSIRPPLQGYPCGDLEKDARTVNSTLEEGIREAPEQYLWSHDRFKRFRRP